VTLRAAGKSVSQYVHRLVLEAFRGPCPEGMWGAHNDGNALHNKLDNLRWDTPRNNMADKRAHGTTNQGERCGSSVLTEEQVCAVYVEVAQGSSYTAVARRFGISEGGVRKIAQGKTWGHLGLAPLAPCAWRTRWSMFEKRLIVAGRRVGLTFDQMARRMDRAPKQVENCYYRVVRRR